MREIKGEKHSKTQKEDSIPSMVAKENIYATRKISLWLGVDHNRQK
jgi:hypothetical protein